MTVVADGLALTTQEAASQLNVSRQYVLRLIDRGNLPTVEVGSHRLIRSSDVFAFKVVQDKSWNTVLERLASLSEAIGKLQAHPLAARGSLRDRSRDPSGPPPGDVAVSSTDALKTTKIR